ncbi:MAG: SRPBCC family protein [Gemmatimonadaceae bacterium]
MGLYILIAVLVLVVAVLALAASKSNTLVIQRSAQIDADASAVFAWLDDFHKWSDWSPWERLDPALQRTFSGSASGKGAVYEWQGNKKVGSGRMEILESSPPRGLRIKLDFFTPFEGHNVTTFALVGRDKATDVTWTMEGPSNFQSKLMRTFINMDKLVGKDFESGLANLKQLAER